MFKPSGIIVLGLLTSASMVLGATAADSVKTRIAGFRELGAAFKAVNDGTRGDVQTVLVQQSAKQVRAASRNIYGWFPKGSGPEAGVKTSAKANIWNDSKTFKAKQDAFAGAAAALETATKGGDADKIRAAAKSLGATCKGCHDLFKAKG